MFSDLNGHFSCIWYLIIDSITENDKTKFTDLSIVILPLTLPLFNSKKDIFNATGLEF